MGRFEKSLQLMINTSSEEEETKVPEFFMIDHAYIGPVFTWSNRQLEGYIVKKLDRVLVNDVWMLEFSHSLVEFLAPEESDHCPALVQLSEVNVFPPKPFKIFNYWTKHPEFLQVVKESWEQPTYRNPMVMLHRKMKRLK